MTPPSVHQMVVTLERAGLISRQPGVARSIAVLVDRSALPELKPRQCSTGHNHGAEVLAHRASRVGRRQLDDSDSRTENAKTSKALHAIGFVLPKSWS